MIRKATAFLLTILLGLYLPAAATSVCICLGPVDQMEAAAPCIEDKACCEDQDQEALGCCDEPGCCLVIPALPDGMEPQLAQTPFPISAPAPIWQTALHLPLPSSESLRSPTSNRAPPPPPGDPIRIAFGVWRL